MTYAFPHNTVVVDKDGGVKEHHRGMELRDYFAAKAMQGIFTGSIEWSATYKYPDDASLEVFKDIAQDSYAIADAMMVAREK